MKNIRIAAISIPERHSQSWKFQSTLKEAEKLVLEAGKAKPGIISLPELFAHCVFPLDRLWRHAEEIKGETISRFARLARRLGSVIVCPIAELAEGKLFNSVVFISPNGQPLDSYRKMVPNLDEMGKGVKPGNGAVVVDTPMGRLGALLCFDLNFLEVHQALRRKRPQIIFWCAMFRGGLRLRYLAIECASYVVGTVQTSNQLINPLGRLINKVGSRQESFPFLPQYLEENINLDFGVYHLDYNMQILTKLRNRYAGRIRLEVAQAEAVFLLELLDHSLSISKIESEFHLERSLDYFDRARHMAGLPDY